jgi:dsRNA-specific ribonuclease
MEYEQEETIYKESLDDSPIVRGERGEKFKDFIRGLVSRGNLTEKYINILTGKEGMDLYSMVFTNPTADPQNNYEMMEMVGDATCNTCLVWYFFRKYPNLNNKEGVKIIAKLKIFYAATKTFFRIAERYGFMPFISAREKRLFHLREKTMEDCFEAFFGATAYLLDTYVRVGVGYAICYEIFKSFFDELVIETRYYRLVDNITKLKELSDSHPVLPRTGSRIMRIEYVKGGFEKKAVGGLVVMNAVAQLENGSKVTIGEGKASKGPVAKQKAAQNALRSLKSVGILRSYESPPEVDDFDEVNITFK